MEKDVGGWRADVGKYLAPAQLGQRRLTRPHQAGIVLHRTTGPCGRHLLEPTGICRTYDAGSQGTSSLGKGQRQDQRIPADAAWKTGTWLAGRGKVAKRASPKSAHGACPDRVGWGEESPK